MKAKVQIKDSEMRRLLAGLRQEVAAPPHFRISLLQRLAAEQGLQSKALPRRAKGLLKPWFAIFRFPALASAAAALALATGLWLTLNPRQSFSPAPPASDLRLARLAKAQLSQAGSNETAPPAAIALPTAPHVVALPRLQKKAAVILEPSGNETVSAPSDVNTAQLPSHNPAPAAALDRAASAAKPDASASVQLPTSAELPLPLFASNASAPNSPPSLVKASGNKPGDSVATPTILGQPLLGNSQVRRNKFLASRGEHCVVLFRLPDAGQAKVEVFDRLGRLVAVLQDSQLPSGLHELHWQGQGQQGELLASGIYLVRVRAGSYDERHKVVLVR